MLTRGLREQWHAIAPATRNKKTIGPMVSDEFYLHYGKFNVSRSEVSQRLWGRKKGAIASQKMQLARSLLFANCPEANCQEQVRAL